MVRHPPRRPSPSPRATSRAADEANLAVEQRATARCVIDGELVGTVDMLHTVPNVFSTEGLTSSQERQRPKRERPNPKPDVEGPLRFGPQCSARESLRP